MATPGLVSRHENSDSVFYTFDERGTTAQRLDENESVLTSHMADAFGTFASSSSTTDPYAGFGSQWGYYKDWETGLQLLGHRYYDAGTGRFVTRDPIGYEGDINLYGYVGNSPTGWIDPYGLTQDSPSNAARQAAARGDLNELKTILETLDESGQAVSPQTKKLVQDLVDKFGSKAKDWIAKKCKGSIHEKFPSEMLDKSLAEIRQLSQKSGPMQERAKTAWKVLNDNRFKKGAKVGLGTAFLDWLLGRNNLQQGG